MPGSTSLEGLPYPCLGDPFQRHWIQDLAQAADLSLFRMQSDINLIDVRPRGRMRWTGGASFLINTYSFLPFNIIDYDIRLGATTDGPDYFAPDLPGLYYCVLEFGMSPAFDITKINPEIVTCDSAGANVITNVGRSFNSDQADFGFTMRQAGLVHVGDVTRQIRGRMRHQGTAQLQSNHITFTAQYLGGCGAQLNANPYMERNIDNWIVDAGPATLTQSAAQVFRGNYSLQIAPGPAVANPIVRSSRFPVTAGQVYSTIVYLYTTVNENYSWGFRFYDAGNVLIGSNFTPATQSQGNVWKRLAITATATANATTAEVRIRRETGTTPSPTFWIDDAEVFSNC